MYTKPMYLDRKLIQDIAVHHDATTNPDVFGVEIELEGRGVKSLKPEILKYWTIHDDGSLRKLRPESEAIEYVFNGPKNLDDTHAGLEVLYNHLNSPAAEVFPSYRTSIHVHLSCALETMRSIFNLMTLSIIFDELLVSQNGEHRIGNNFCLRARDAQGQLTEITQSIEQFGNFFHVSNQNRYSSINFVSLTKFGTIEFRSLECTTDLQRVLHWVYTLNRLREAARKFDDPRDVIRKFNEMSPKEFLWSILKEQATKYEKVEGWERMLHSGMRLAQDLAYSSKWIRADKKENDPKKVVPKKPKPPKPLGLGSTSGMTAGQLYQYYASQAGMNSSHPQQAPQPAPMAEPWPTIHWQSDPTGNTLHVDLETFNYYDTNF